MGRSLILACVLVLLGTGGAEAKDCKNSQPCGNSCISWSKTCHVGSGNSKYAPPRPSSKSRSPSLKAPGSEAKSESRAPDPGARASDPASAAPTTRAADPAAEKVTPNVDPAEPVSATVAVAVPSSPPPAPSLAGAENQGTRLTLFGGLYTGLVVLASAISRGTKREV